MTHQEYLRQEAINLKRKLQNHKWSPKQPRKDVEVINSAIQRISAIANGIDAEIKGLIDKGG